MSWLVMEFIKVGLLEVFETDTAGDMLKMQSLCVPICLKKQSPQVMEV